MQNSDKYIVPKKHYFLGDNRDCSKDMYLSSVGYVNENNIVAKAQIIFFLMIQLLTDFINSGIGQNLAI